RRAGGDVRRTRQPGHAPTLLPGPRLASARCTGDHLSARREHRLRRTYRDLAGTGQARAPRVSCHTGAGAGAAWSRVRVTTTPSRQHDRGRARIVRTPCVSEEAAGLLLIDKPAGLTSHDVVDVCRRAYGQRSIGHLGTLDPFATGLLVLLFGRATRLATFIENEPKVYDATIR